ncbi:hypothetical protein TNCV_3575231 [Trichonephila clavipes]|nr:hypothetical protein TNCV_3575231 [Trichonephila clavipes]
MVHILQEFQQASGTVVSINAIYKEAHLLGFHGPVAAYKSLITQYNHTTRLKWCKTLKNETSHKWKQFLWIVNQDSISMS